MASLVRPAARLSSPFPPQHNIFHRISAYHSLLDLHSVFPSNSPSPNRTRFSLMLYFLQGSSYQAPVMAISLDLRFFFRFFCYSHGQEGFCSFAAVKGQPLTQLAGKCKMNRGAPPPLLQALPAAVYFSLGQIQACHQLARPRRPAEPSYRLETWG